MKENSANFKKELLSPRISLFGGEPLLKSNYGIVEKILEFAEQICIPVAIVTNGTTLDDDWFKLFEKYKKFMLFQITIDGNKAIHDIRRIRADGSGTFEKICDNVEKILKIGMHLHLRINIDNENINNISELKDVFDKRGWSKNEFFTPYASPVRCFKSGDMPENILTDSEILDTFMTNGWYGKDDSFLKSLVSPVFGVVTRFFEMPKNRIKPWKKTYCEGTFGGNYCFTPDGTVTTCLTCVGNEDYGIGKFDEDGVKIDKNIIR
ncbi:MAG: radical SAM protein [Firmicutes bacterium]|nr:radical SAM protein [Bacillota bacterium]